MAPNPAAARKGDLHLKRVRERHGRRGRNGARVKFKGGIKSSRARNRKKQKREGSLKKRMRFHDDSYVSFRWRCKKVCSYTQVRRSLTTQKSRKHKNLKPCLCLGPQNIISLEPPLEFFFFGRRKVRTVVKSFWSQFFDVAKSLGLDALEGETS